MFALDSIQLDGSIQSQCAVDTVMDRVNNGELVIWRRGMQDLKVMDQAVDLVLNSVRKISGSNAAEAVAKNGVENIHHHVALDDVEAVYKAARVSLAEKMPAVTAQTFRALGVDGEFYVHDASLIRLMMPFDVMKSKQQDFKKHLGKLTLHGPHHDHYQNVPVNAINTWTAIGRVDADNGMLIYPEIWGKNLPMENGEIRSDQYLGKPVAVEMDPGDILIFHSNHMHASRINTTSETRVVLTNRICLEKPDYPDSARPQKYFVSSAFPENLDMSNIFSQKGFVGNKGKTLKTGLSRGLHKIATKAGFDFRKMPKETSNSINLTPVAREGLQSSLGEGELVVLDEKTCATKVDGEVIAFRRQCPHQGADLALGFVEDGKVFCPYHGLKICVKSGESACSSINKLKAEVIA